MIQRSGSLKLRDVRFGFPDRRDFLGPVTLEVQPGTCWGIVGPNGAGKSTLLRLMGGLLSPSAGDVLLDGRALHRTSPRDRAKVMAFMPQSISIDDDLTVRDTVLMGRYPHRSLGLFESSDDQRVADRVQAWTETTAFSERKLGTLSGGEAQRVHLAAALAQEPRILLLDEPTGSLDLRHQLSIFELLRDASLSRSLGVVVVTHDVNLAGRFCTDVVVLNQGKVAGLGSPGAVLSPELLGGVFGVPMVRARDSESGTDWLAPVSGRRA